MLPKVEGLPLSNLPIENGRLIADLIYFDGALLSYYQDNNRGHYLYYWCDADETHNRWLIVQVGHNSLRDFLSRLMTLRELILDAGRNQVYLIDLGDALQRSNILRVQLSDLPENYLPADESWYDVSLSVFHDQLAARELMSMMQDSLQEAHSKLKRIKQIVGQNSEATQSEPLGS